MSYANFIPQVWSAVIERERERQCIAARLCWREFEGDIKDAGDTVKIQGITRPTIATYTKNSTSITPQNLEDASMSMKVDQAKYFAFEIDDIDKRQAKGNLMGAQMSEAAAAMAENVDDYIYALYASACSTINAASATSATILGLIADGLKVLWDNNVPKNTDVYLEMSPAMLVKVLLAKIVHAQPNDRTVDNGFEGMILGAKTYMSNGVYNDGTYDYCFLRTKKAIAFASQISKTEAYRPESSFSDAVKGLQVYGAKVVRPKELVAIKFSAGAETTI